MSDEQRIDPSVYLHESAQLYGRIEIGAESSIWPHVVMRAEAHHVRIGRYTNIQDFVMIHEGAAHPTIIGEDCSITHHVTLHGCEIGDRCLIGIGAVIMDGAKIGDNSIVAGNAIVTEGAEFPPNSVIGGVPTKLLATRDNSEANLKNAEFYSANAAAYAAGSERLVED